MLEIPEANVIAGQINEHLRGRRVIAVSANESPHKFAWFYGDPQLYEARLMDKEVRSAAAWGGQIEIDFGKTKVVVGDGVNLRLYEKDINLPSKHQLLVRFEDGASLVMSIQMYGGIWCFEEGEFDNPYYLGAKAKPSPLADAFSWDYFLQLLSADGAEKLSMKAFLATEQRIPGLGNGVLQDILLNMGLHPKRKLATVDETEREKLFNTLKSTLFNMTIHGGRDTAKDLYGNPGGYKTRLSKNTVSKPCDFCGAMIQKAAYMGGSIYFCPDCHKET